MKAEIAIGGDVRREDLAGLVEQIHQADVSWDWGGPNAQFDHADDYSEQLLDVLIDGHLVLRDDEAAYGEFPELEAWLQNHKVPYDRHHSAKYEFDAEIVYYRPDSGLQSFLATDDGAPLVRVSDVLDVLYKDGVDKGLDDIHDGLAGLLDHPDSLPPFRIVEPVASPPEAVRAPANAYPGLRPGERLVEVAWMEGVAGLGDAAAGHWRFAVEVQITDAELALRDAIKAYLAQPGANPDKVAFNWGDAVIELSPEDWSRFGLRLLDDVVGAQKIVVDHNEVFSGRK
jgi:hypothetical protein